MQCPSKSQKCPTLVNITRNIARIIIRWKFISQIQRKFYTRTDIKILRDCLHVYYILRTHTELERGRTTNPNKKKKNVKNIWLTDLKSWLFSKRNRGNATVLLRNGVVSMFSLAWSSEFRKFNTILLLILNNDFSSYAIRTQFRI